MPLDHNHFTIGHSHIVCKYVPNSLLLHNVQMGGEQRWSWHFRSSKGIPIGNFWLTTNYILPVANSRFCSNKADWSESDRLTKWGFKILDFSATQLPYEVKRLCHYNTYRDSTDRSLFVSSGCHNDVSQHVQQSRKKYKKSRELTVSIRDVI